MKKGLLSRYATKKINSKYYSSISFSKNKWEQIDDSPTNKKNDQLYRRVLLTEKIKKKKLDYHNNFPFPQGTIYLQFIPMIDIFPFPQMEIPVSTIEN